MSAIGRAAGTWTFPQFGIGGNLRGRDRPFDGFFMTLGGRKQEFKTEDEAFQSRTEQLLERERKRELTYDREAPYISVSVHPPPIPHTTKTIFGQDVELSRKAPNVDVEAYELGIQRLGSTSLHCCHRPVCRCRDGGAGLFRSLDEATFGSSGEAWCREVAPVPEQPAGHDPTVARRCGLTGHVLLLDCGIRC